MSENRLQQKPDDIIRDHVFYASLAGAIPVPVVDVAAVTMVHLDMLKDLTQAYGIEYKEEQLKSLIASISGAALARWGASWLKIIPGIGTAAGTVSQSVIAGASTYALGRIFDRHYSAKGTLADFDEKESRSMFEELLDEGREFVKTMRSSFTGSEKDAAGRIFNRISELKKLHDEGAISGEEFESTRTALLEQLKQTS